jgi:hypothetical protein
VVLVGRHYVDLDPHIFAATYLAHLHRRRQWACRGYLSSPDSSKCLWSDLLLVKHLLSQGFWTSSLRPSAEQEKLPSPLQDFSISCSLSRSELETCSPGVQALSLDSSIDSCGRYQWAAHWQPLLGCETLLRAFRREQVIWMLYESLLSLGSGCEHERACSPMLHARA